MTEEIINDHHVPVVCTGCNNTLKNPHQLFKHLKGEWANSSCLNADLQNVSVLNIVRLVDVLNNRTPSIDVGTGKKQKLELHPLQVQFKKLKLVSGAKRCNWVKQNVANLNQKLQATGSNHGYNEAAKLLITQNIPKDVEAMPQESPIELIEELPITLPQDHPGTTSNPESEVSKSPQVDDDLISFNTGTVKISYEDIRKLGKELMQGVPEEMACKLLGIDQSSLLQYLHQNTEDCIKARALINKCKATFQKDVLMKMLNSDNMNKREAAKEYSNFVQKSESNALWRKYEILAILLTAKRALQPDAWRTLIDAYALLDNEMTVMALDDVLCPTGLV
jgi:hypothetical protein